MLLAGLVVAGVVTAPTISGGLVVAVPASWAWYLRQNITPGHGTIIGGLFVVIAAAIAYTGTHHTRTSTERIAEDKNKLDTANAKRAHNLADIQELRQRFISTANQFADPSTEVRLAGVYALEALTNDWIDRHNHTDAQTCINYFCGYLTRTYTPPTHDPHLRQTVVTPDIGTRVQRTFVHPHDDLNVRQAIVRTIARHLRPGASPHDWSAYDYDLSGAYFRDANFSDCRFLGTVDLTNAYFGGDNATFDRAEFHGNRTTFSHARFAGQYATFESSKFHSEWTLFTGALFHSSQTSFRDAEFGGQMVVLNGAYFRGLLATFDEAEFHNDMTHFLGSKFHSEETTFDGSKFYARSTGFQRVEFGSPQSDTSETTFDRAEFLGERTWLNNAQFHGSHTSFKETKFHGKRVTFKSSEFHSGLTSFEQVEFCADRTIFSLAKFKGPRTSFDHPTEWKNVHFDWDDPDSTEKPANVTPYDWPPLTAEEI